MTDDVADLIGGIIPGKHDMIYIMAQYSEDKMLEEINKCKCGGEGHLVSWSYAGNTFSYNVYCGECFNTTDGYDTEAEAINAWNNGKVMSAFIRNEVTNA